MHVYELKSAAALVTGESGFWKANYNFFYRKIFCQLVNGSFLLPGMRFYGKGFLRRFLRLAVLTDLCLIEQAHLVFAQNIALLLTGLAEAGSLRIGKDFIHVFQFLLQLRVFLLQCFYRLGQRVDELRNFRSAAAMNSPPKTAFTCLYYTIKAGKSTEIYAIFRTFLLE